MISKRPIASLLAAVSLLSLSACVTDPNTGEKKASRTVLGGAGGAVVGGILGSVIGGKTGRIIGAGLGGVAGAAVGYKMDQQIKELKEDTAGSGVDVTETDNGQAILVNLPDGVTFATNSSTVSAEFQATLDKVAESLVKYPASLVDVYGYTDSTGSEDYNMKLSQARAKAVGDYLISRGVTATRIKTQGFGENNFVASNDTPEGRSKNRRVEIKIVPVSQEEIQSAGH